MMTSQELKTNMVAADTFRSLATEPFEPDFWAGYMRGIRRNYHGENFGTDDEHNLWMLCAEETRDTQRKMRGLGYRCGYEGQNAQQAMKILTGRQYMSEIGSRKSETKARAARKNGLKGGRPVGSGDLTDLQKELYKLRRQGLKIKEIAQQTGRRPENVRQILARVATKLGIKGSWMGIEPATSGKEG